MKLWIILALFVVISAVEGQKDKGKEKEKEKAKAPPQGKTNPKTTPKTLTGTSTTKKLNKPPAKSSNDPFANCMCQDDIGMDGFSSSKFEGVWYMFDRQSVITLCPLTGDCSKVSITSTKTKNSYQFATTSVFAISTMTSNDNIIYRGQGVFDWKVTSMKISTTYTDDTKKPDVVDAPINATLKIVVIYTDYNNLAVLFICGDYSIGALPSKETTTTTTKSSSKKAEMPPNMFAIMTRSKDSVKIDMDEVRNIIKSKYSCYYNTNDKPAQDNKSCKAVA